MATKQITQTKQSQASKRLLKKISALRATLPADERKVLDSLIVTEVQAHRLTDKKPVARAGMTKPSARKSVGTKDQADEARAHISRPRNVVTKATDRKEHGAEVEAHRLHTKAAVNKTSPTKEVEAHLLKGRAIPGKASVSKYDSKEVSAHRFNTRTTTNRLSGGKADTDEVRAHAARPKATPTKTTTSRTIVFDKDSQEYKLAD